MWSSKAMKNVDRGVRISENLFTKIKQTMLNLIINIAVEIFFKEMGTSILLILHLCDDYRVRFHNKRHL